MTRRALVVFIGESFRTGNHGSRVRGRPDSRPGQLTALASHSRFLQHLKLHHDIQPDVTVGTYTTPYDKDIINAYRPYLVNTTFLPSTIAIGINNCFKAAVQPVDLTPYDFLLYIRIDMCLKDAFFALFDPTWKEIRFATVCFKKDGHNIYKGKPRISDMMLYMPKRFYSCLQRDILVHEGWYILNQELGIDDEDIDVMLDTFHDSHSVEDWNPLYYIVNRREATTTWTDPNDVFDKRKPPYAP